MFDVNLGKPTELIAYEYTDVNMKIQLFNYVYAFEKWGNDNRYIYSHEKLSSELENINKTLSDNVPKCYFLFISLVSNVLILLNYIGLTVFFIINPNLPLAFFFSCSLLVSLVYNLLCKVFQHYTTKKIIHIVEKAVKRLNKQFSGEYVRFKFINCNESMMKHINILSYKNADAFTLRIIYTYCIVV